MVAAVGRIVHYALSDENAAAINKRRKDSGANLGAIQTDALGYVAHVGNHAEAGQVFPLIITRVWSEDCINGQVLLDGNDSLWLTSASKANEHQLTQAAGSPVPGRWFWPPRV